MDHLHDVQQAKDEVKPIEAIESIRKRLDAWRFVAVNETDLQAQVTQALAGFHREREVIAQRGRYDILVTIEGTAVVLELKVKGSAAEVERQAQRYALTDGIDAVVIVTTSQRLAQQLARGGDILGGKAFSVIALRSF